MKRQFLISVLAVAAVLSIAWSLAAPWAAAFPGRQDHYKVSLFGVRHISDMTAHPTQTRCKWSQRLDTCAVGKLDNYTQLSRARYYVLGGFALLVLAIITLRLPSLGIWTAASFLLAAMAVGVAISLVRSNTQPALAAFSGAQVEMNGTGMFAAEIAAGLCFLAAAIAAIPLFRKHAPGK